jgi:hypothetical protein
LTVDEALRALTGLHQKPTPLPSFRNLLTEFGDLGRMNKRRTLFKLTENALEFYGIRVINELLRRS